MTLNVLIAEDELNLLELFSKCMKSLGCNVSGFNTCQEAMLEILKNPNYDLVITDLKQVPYSGVDLAKLAVAKCKNPYVVVCTGESEEEKLALARAFSDKVILKPDFMSNYSKIFSLAQERVNQVETN
ncbi:response regulator [Candidatus Woesearchaeota archaeon]|nr:response regulator [Candidatus Woesearchaeota archaeon]